MNDTLAASLPDAGDANHDNHAQGLTLAGSRHSEHPQPADTNGSPDHRCHRRCSRRLRRYLSRVVERPGNCDAVPSSSDDALRRPVIGMCGRSATRVGTHQRFGVLASEAGGPGMSRSGPWEARLAEEARNTT
jgi:hypothetical protein